MLPIAASAHGWIKTQVPFSLHYLASFGPMLSAIIVSGVTAGSLLLVILFHVFFNWLSVSEAGGQFVGYLMTVPVIVWSIYVVRRYQPENASPLVKQIA
jgi:hypothetical protein